MFGWLFFITQFPSLITLKYHTRLAPSLNIFHTICGPHTCHSVQLFFFFSISLNPVKKKKRKKEKKPKLEGRRTSHLVWKEKEKKEDEETHAPNPVKKKKTWSKVAAKVWQWVPPCNVICGNAIELWIMETKNS